jgi:5-formyltetrahydrofolate cyclo-ligase
METTDISVPVVAGSVSEERHARLSAAAEAKQRLRRLTLSKLRSLPAAEATQYSRIICQRLTDTPEFRRAECVALYNALPDEVQTLTTVEEWYELKTVALPVVIGNDVVFYKYEGSNKLRRGAYGIYEPVGTQAIAIEAVSLFVVPGVAFDRQGNRLGRGKGYYDRLLAKCNRPVIALCYSFQLLDDVPTEPHDKKMSMIITEEKQITL